MFERLKALFFPNKKQASSLKIKYLDDPMAIELDGYYVVGDGVLRGPYKREKDAKGVRTRIIKAHG